MIFGFPENVGEWDWALRLEWKPVDQLGCYPKNCQSGPGNEQWPPQLEVRWFLVGPKSETCLLRATRAVRRPLSFQMSV